MLKYVDVRVTFAEVPDEICLCIDFSNCSFRCEECHSPYLQEDIGEELTVEKLQEIIEKNEGITCVCLMGGTPKEINNIASIIKNTTPYKVAWYTGMPFIHTEYTNLDYFDYIKIGGYMKSKGGLDSPTTNQRMYKIENITHEFWHDKP